MSARRLAPAHQPGRMQFWRATARTQAAGHLPQRRSPGRPGPLPQSYKPPRRCDQGPVPMPSDAGTAITRRHPPLDHVGQKQDRHDEADDTERGDYSSMQARAVPGEQPAPITSQHDPGSRRAQNWSFCAQVPRDGNSSVSLEYSAIRSGGGVYGMRPVSAMGGASGCGGLRDLRGDRRRRGRGS
jgi:hypothetical protein